MPTKEEIVRELRESVGLVDEDDDDSMEFPKIKSKEAIKMMENIELFWLQQSSNQDGNLTLIRKMNLRTR